MGVAVWCVIVRLGGGGDGIGIDTGISYRPLSVQRPSIITWLSLMIFTWNCEKMAVQLSSHSCPNDIKEPVLISSKMITFGPCVTVCLICLF